MESFKQSLSKFRQWQQDSLMHIPSVSNNQHTCHCCQTDYTGNFCPRCGQKAGVGPISWQSVRRSVMDLWGLGSRSLPYSLWLRNLSGFCFGLHSVRHGSQRNGGRLVPSGVQQILFHSICYSISFLHLRNWLGYQPDSFQKST